MKAALPDVEGDPQEEWAPLIDVSNAQRLMELAAAGEGSALGRSVQRLVRSLDDPNGVISAFNSYVE